MMLSPRSLLALVLLVGFYVLVAGLALASLHIAMDGVSLSLQSLAIKRPDAGDTIGANPFYFLLGIFMFGAGISVGMPCLIGIFVASARTHGLVAGSIRISREDAPELWNIVTCLAKEVGAEEPAELWLTAEANGAVSEDISLLGIKVGTRRMYIGVPLLIGLRTDELRAVICHELAHYAGQHTRFSGLAYRGSVALASTRQRIALSQMPRGPLLWWSLGCRALLWGYTRLYDGVTLAIRRRQEIEADAAAARVVGRTTIENALRSTYAVTAAWRDFTARSATPASDRSPPTDPFEAFQAMITDPRYRDEVLAVYRMNPPEEARSTFDSHPPLSRRLMMLNRYPDTLVTNDSSPAIHLVQYSQVASLRMLLKAKLAPEPKLSAHVEAGQRGRRFTVWPWLVVALIGLTSAIVFAVSLETHPPYSFQIGAAGDRCDPPQTGPRRFSTFYFTPYGDTLRCDESETLGPPKAQIDSYPYYTNGDRFGFLYEYFSSEETWQIRSLAGSLGNRDLLTADDLRQLEELARRIADQKGFRPTRPQDAANYTFNFGVILALGISFLLVYRYAVNDHDPSYRP